MAGSEGKGKVGCMIAAMHPVAKYSASDDAGISHNGWLHLSPLYRQSDVAMRSITGSCEGLFAPPQINHDSNVDDGGLHHPRTPIFATGRLPNQSQTTRPTFLITSRTSPPSSPLCTITGRPASPPSLTDVTRGIRPDHSDSNIMMISSSSSSFYPARRHTKHRQLQLRGSLGEAR